MFTYHTKSFIADRPDAVSDWLNSLYKGGYGVKVVGYVAVGDAHSQVPDTVMVTVLRWKISDKPAADRSPARTTIDEIPEEPSVQVGDEEV